MAETDRHISIMCALAVEVAFTRWILLQFEARTGIATELRWDPTTALIRRVREGERADVILAIDDAINKLGEDGLVRRETRMPVARGLIGLAVKRGAPRPDISTVAALRQALLDAQAVAYSLGGASGIYFQQLIGQLGIADAVNARATTIPSGFTAAKVASGEAELAVQQISELMSIEGVDIVGPFPDEVQIFTDFSAAIFTDARNPAGAALFLETLATEASVSAYAKGGVISLVPTPSSA